MLAWVVAASMLGQPGEAKKPLAGGEPIQADKPTTAPWFPSATVGDVRATVVDDLHMLGRGYFIVEFANLSDSRDVSFATSDSAAPTLTGPNGAVFRLHDKQRLPPAAKIKPKHFETVLFQFAGVPKDADLVLTIPGAFVGAGKDFVIRCPAGSLDRDFRAELADWRQTRGTTAVDVLGFTPPGKAFVRLLPGKKTRYVVAGDRLGDLVVASVDPAKGAVVLKDADGKPRTFTKK